MCHIAAGMRSQSSRTADEQFTASRGATRTCPQPSRAQRHDPQIWGGLNDSRCDPQVMDMPVLRPLLLALSLAVAMVTFPMAASAMPRHPFSASGRWTAQPPSPEVSGRLFCAGPPVTAGSTWLPVPVRRCARRQPGRSASPDRSRAAAW